MGPPDCGSHRASADRANPRQRLRRPAPQRYGYPTFIASFAGGAVELTAPFPAPVGAWTHLGVTYNGALASLFVNGVAVATASVTKEVADVFNALFRMVP